MARLDEADLEGIRLVSRGAQRPRDDGVPVLLGIVVADPEHPHEIPRGDFVETKTNVAQREGHVRSMNGDGGMIRR